jgi:hypothetical protein
VLFSNFAMFFELVFDIIMHKFSWACLLAKNIVAKWMWVYFELMKFTFKVLLHITHKQHGTTKISFAAVANDIFGAQYYSHRLIRFCLVCSFGSVSLVAVANWRFGVQCYLHRWFKFSLVMLIWISSLAYSSSWFLFLGLEFSTTN